MEEVVFYIAEGSANDKHSVESLATVAPLHSSKQFVSFRQADCTQNGASLTGIGPGERLFACSKSKALINVYSWGKEGVDQRIPIPEPLTCITSAKQLGNGTGKLPWLVAGGSKSGKIYLWEVASGNLLAVKEAHYQPITVLKFSSCGTYLVSGSEDTRCLIWRTLDLLSIYNSSLSHESVKPYAAFHDHSLPVTDLLVLPSGLINDLKLYTVSLDNTLRIYDITTKKLLTTFVLPYGIECLTMDPASRAIYVGMSNGLIRTIPLYTITNSTLESVGGNNKIITVDNDVELKYLFVHHQQKAVKKKNEPEIDPETPIKVTQLTISLDGTNLISGDSVGRVFVSDTVTRQVVKNFNLLNSAISQVQTFVVGEELGENEKNRLLLPQFKRILASSEAKEHFINVELVPASEETDDFDSWLNEKAEEELQFKNISQINSSVVVAQGNVEEKFTKLASAYNELKAKHEELYDEHMKLLNEQ